MMFQRRDTVSIAGSDEGEETTWIGSSRKSVNSFRQVDSVEHEDISAADGARIGERDKWNG